MNTAKQKLKLFLNDHKKIASNMRYRKSSNTLAFFLGHMWLGVE